eukprot:18063-Heterococcus_DN1.PRE.4
MSAVRQYQYVDCVMQNKLHASSSSSTIARQQQQTLQQGCKQQFDTDMKINMNKCGSSFIRTKSKD